MNSKEIYIETNRIFLKGIRLCDVDSLYQYRSNPAVYEYQFWRPRGIDDVKNFIEKIITNIFNVPDTWYQLGIFLKEENKLIGDIGLHFIGSDNSQVEIGYTLSPVYQGNGYAVEAVSEVINFLFHNLKKHRIIASVDPRNIKSIALLERIGMRKEAHFIKSLWFNGEWVDDMVFAILEEEW